MRGALRVGELEGVVEEEEGVGPVAGVGGALGGVGGVEPREVLGRRGAEARGDELLRAVSHGFVGKAWPGGGLGGGLAFRLSSLVFCPLSRAVLALGAFLAWGLSCDCGTGSVVRNVSVRSTAPDYMHRGQSKGGNGRSTSPCPRQKCHCSAESLCLMHFR